MIAPSATGGCGCSAPGPTSSDPDWRFVNVRRLMAMIEKALDDRAAVGRLRARRVLTRARVQADGDQLPARPARGRHARRRSPQRNRSTCSATSTTTRRRSTTWAELLVEVGIAPVAAVRVRRRPGRPGAATRCRSGSRDRAPEGGGMTMIGPIAAATGIRLDPPLNHNFVITMCETSSPGPRSSIGRASVVGDVLIGGFSECTGLDMTQMDEKRHEGGRNDTELRFPTRITWTNLTLKPGRLAHQPERLGLALRLRRREGQADGRARRAARRRPCRTTSGRSSAAFPVKFTGPVAERGSATRWPWRRSRSRTRACGSCRSSSSARRPWG